MDSETKSVVQKQRVLVTPRCVLCGYAHPQTTDDPRIFYCPDCKRQFDPEDDGTVGKSKDPAVVAERREEFRLRQMARRRR
jgi:hypothetical protein